MKILRTALVAATLGVTDAASLRSRFGSAENAADAYARDLQGVGCNGSSNPAPAWHPTRPDGSWFNGFCIFTTDCNSPAYDTELECCNAAFGGQVSGACLAELPSPPTLSPTETGGLDVYYPDYDTAWTEAGCTNDRPLPSGRPTYATMLECCQGAYGGQVSGACLSGLPSPPTMSPTETGGLDVYYPDYDTTWSVAGCINTRPLPSGRPTYATMLECCQGAYGGQVSGACLSGLPSPPTMSPTETGGLDVYYPDYDTAWTEAGCINDRPLPSGRPTYSTMLECCQGAYGGQTSGACLSALPNPPTMSPTETGGLDVYYPDYDQPSWFEGFCINTRPLPSGRPTYATMLECCQASYGGQVSGTCLSMLPSPPTTAPTQTGGLDVFYPDYDVAWPEGTCINTRPLPSGRPTYATMLDCCKGAYNGQTTGACLAALPSPPTMSPTETGGLDVFYPDYDNQPSWSLGFCVNTRPLPSGRPTYATMLECCQGSYAGQTSGTCLSLLPSPPTASPTASGGLDVFYPDYANFAWSDGICINTRPLPSGRPTATTKVQCCSDNYRGQVSNACMCDAVGICFSCNCGSQAERDAAGGCPGLTCS